MTTDIESPVWLALVDATYLEPDPEGFLGGFVWIASVAASEQSFRDRCSAEVANMGMAVEEFSIVETADERTLRQDGLSPVLRRLVRKSRHTDSVVVGVIQRYRENDE